MRSYLFIPGAVAANTPINLPADIPDLDTLVAARLLSMGQYTAAADNAPNDLTVVTASGNLAAGQIRLNGARQIQLGDATTTFDVIELVVVPVGTRVPV